MLKLFEALPAFDPCFLRDIERLFLIAQHAEGAGVDLVPMAMHQLLVRGHIALLGGSHQLVISSIGDVEIGHG